MDLGKPVPLHSRQVCSLILGSPFQPPRGSSKRVSKQRPHRVGTAYLNASTLT
jgi:hypothetical protein